MLQWCSAVKTAVTAGAGSQLKYSGLAIGAGFLDEYRDGGLFARPPAGQTSGGVGAAEEFEERPRVETARQMALGTTNVAELEPAISHLVAPLRAARHVPPPDSHVLLGGPESGEVGRGLLVHAEHSIRLQIGAVASQDVAVSGCSFQPTRSYWLNPSPTTSIPSNQTKGAYNCKAVPALVGFSAESSQR